MLFDLSKAFDRIESSHKLDLRKEQYYLHAWATCSELPFDISTMGPSMQRSLPKTDRSYKNGT